MIVEERTYVLSPAYALNDYMEPYRTIGLPVQREILGGLMGGYTTEVGELHALVHLWAYRSFEDRLERRARLAAHPQWQQCLAIIRPMIRTMHNRLLIPNDYSPLPDLGSA
jgi:hypothetical protein